MHGLGAADVSSSLAPAAIAVPTMSATLPLQVGISLPIESCAALGVPWQLAGAVRLNDESERNARVSQEVGTWRPDEATNRRP